MTELIFIVAGLLTISYVVLILAYRYGWRLEQECVQRENYEPVTPISVIIPARNEENNIAACIESALAQQYPRGLLEIIVVDDHSEDATAGIVQQYAHKGVRYVCLADHIAEGQRVNAFKKAALAAGISESKGRLIVTTDADCVATPKWLASIAAAFEKEQAMMVVAPVIYATDKSIVQIFQLIDFMSMQGITVAAHNLGLGNMSNGANLAFDKAAYLDAGGYKGIEHLASGDDYLLMMKMKSKVGGMITYVKSREAIVTTAPQPDWASFLRQRVRWASKSGKYDDKRLTAVLLLVYLFNLSFLVVAVVGILYPVLFLLLGGMLLLKIIAEYIFLVPVAKFFNKEYALKYLPWLQPLHIAYIILAGFLGMMGGYKWKGRRVK